MKSGWPTKQLGDLCFLTSGGTPSKDNPGFWVGDIPFVSARDLKSDHIKTAFLHISREAVEQSATKVAPVGSLLMLVRGMGLANGIQIGEVTAPVAFNQDIRAIHPPLASVIPRFLLLALRNSFMNGEGGRVLSSAAHGTLKIDADLLHQIVIPLPSLSEQQRIVALLDEAFVGIATATANAETSLRQSRGVFQCKLDATFGAEAWLMQPLSAVCSVFADGDWIESKDQSGDGIRLIQTGNVGAGVFKQRESKARYISERTFDRLRCTEIFPGDCLVSRLPDPVGRSCLLPDTGSRMITAVDCTIIRFNERQVRPDFFVNYSLSSAYLRAIQAATTGTTRDRISRSNLGRVPMPTPPLSEQRRIVEELSAVEADVRRLESIYARKLAGLDELKKSLLQRAFSGEL